MEDWVLGLILGGAVIGFIGCICLLVWYLCGARCCPKWADNQVYPSQQDEEGGKVDQQTQEESRRSCGLFCCCGPGTHRVSSKLEVITHSQTQLQVHIKRSNSPSVSCCISACCKTSGRKISLQEVSTTELQKPATPPPIIPPTNTPITEPHIQSIDQSIELEQPQAALSVEPNIEKDVATAEPQKIEVKPREVEASTETVAIVHQTSSVEKSDVVAPTEMEASLQDMDTTSPNLDISDPNKEIEEPPVNILDLKADTDEPEMNIELESIIEPDEQDIHADVAVKKVSFCHAVDEIRYPALTPLPDSDISSVASFEVAEPSIETDLTLQEIEAEPIEIPDIIAQESIAVDQPDASIDLNNDINVETINDVAINENYDLTTTPSAEPSQENTADTTFTDVQQIQATTPEPIHDSEVKTLDTHNQSIENDSTCIGVGLAMKHVPLNDVDTNSITLCGSLPSEGVTAGVEMAIMMLFPDNGDINEFAVSTVHENGESIPCTYDHQAGMGVVVITFTPTTAGYYIMTIKYGDAEIPSSPMRLLVVWPAGYIPTEVLDEQKNGLGMEGIGAQEVTTADEFDTASIVLSGDGLPPQGVVTGEMTSFMILFPGNGDVNQLSVSITHENGESSPCTFEHQAGMGVVSICFTPTVIGNYIITIKYNGVEISSSPIHVLVNGNRSTEEELTVPLITDVEMEKNQEDIKLPEAEIDMTATTTPVVEEETSLTAIDTKPDTAIVASSPNDTQTIPDEDITIAKVVESETQPDNATQPDISSPETEISTKSPESEIKIDQHEEILTENTPDIQQDVIQKDIDEPQDTVALDIEKDQEDENADDDYEDDFEEPDPEEEKELDEKAEKDKEVDDTNEKEAGATEETASRALEEDTSEKSKERHQQQSEP